MAYELRHAWTGKEASDITDKGDLLGLTASRHTELTSPYMHLISTIAHRVKGRERAETKQ